MFKLVLFVLISITLILLSVFVNGLIELYRQEEEDKKNSIRDGMEGYLDQTFGYGAVKLFKSMFDAEGNVSYLVYLPHYQWFKTPEYKWYEVYATHNGFKHSEIER